MAAIETRPIPGPLGIGDLIDRAFRLFRARFWLLLAATAIFLVPLGIVSGLLIGQFTTGYFDLLTRSTSGSRMTNAQVQDLLAGTAGFYGALLLTVLLSVPATAMATLAATDLGDATLTGRLGGLGPSLRRALGRLLPYIGMLILQWLAIVAAVIVVLIPFVILAAIVAAVFAAGGGRSNPGPAAVAGIVILILVAYLLLLALLLLPALYLSTRWIAATPALLVEGLGPMEALRRSWRLTTRQFWRCLGFLLLISLIGWLVAWLPLMAIQQTAMLMAGPNNLGWLTGVSSGFSQIGNVLWLPLQAAAMVVLYYDLRVRQESYDLTLRVEQLEQQVAPTLAGGDAPSRQEAGTASETEA